MSHENGPVQSVAKALRLLGLLMEVHQPLTLAALSEQTGWPKSTIHGLLSTMRESAVVDQQSDGRYCLGRRLFEYGCAVGASWSVSDLAKPHLQHLASVTGQSVFLSMLNRSEVITIEQVQSRAGLRVVSEVGTRLPLHCTSQGKVFLSAMADHEAKRVLSRRTLEPYTRSFGMRTLTAAHQCENGEDVSAKLRVRCLDNYHAQHYNKTHKKPPFAVFLRIGG